MAYVYTLGKRQDVLRDNFDRRKLSEKYRNTAVGMLGTQRRTILQNELLIRHRIGKQKENHTFPTLKEMVFGIESQRNPMQNILHHQEFMKPVDAGRLPHPDFIWANKASVAANLYTTKQYNKYLKDNYDMFCTKREKRFVSEIFRPVYKPKLPEHCMYSLLSNKYQRLWEAEQEAKNLIKMELLWKERYVSCNTKNLILNTPKEVIERPGKEMHFKWNNAKSRLDTKR